MAQQTSYNFEKLTTAQGLSNNRITCILQDRQGFYWIGTEDGLNRFDGSSFRIFRNEKNDPHSLIHNFCVSLLEDNNGDIWIATFHGISVFIKKEGRFKNMILEHPKTDKNLLNHIWGIVKDGEGNIWISSYGIWKYDWRDEKFINYSISGYQSSTNRLPVILNLNYDSVNRGIWFSVQDFILFLDIHQKQVHNSYNNPRNWKIFSQPLNSHFILDRKNRLWFFNDSTKKLSFFNIQENKITETPFRMLRGVRKLKADAENRIWISFWNGYSMIYNPEQEKTDSSLFLQQHPYSAISDQFTDFYVDNDSNYWVGSSRGVSVLRPERQFYQVYTMNENIIIPGQVSFAINALAEKNNDELFVGTTAGLYEYKLSERKYKKIASTEFSHPVISLYFSKENNRLWIGQNVRILLYDTKANRLIKTIPVKYYPVFIMGDEIRRQVWVGTWMSGLYRINNSGEILTYYSKEKNDSSFLKSNSLIMGNLTHNETWFGFNGGNGFAKYDYTNATFRYYNSDISNQGIKLGPINTIAPDKTGNLWIGTYGGGIFYWDRKRNTYKQYLQTDGLGSNFIHNIVTDGNDNLWVSNAGGIDFFQRSLQKFISLKIDFSFFSSDYRNSVLAGTDGKLYFFNSNNIIRIDPAKYAFPQRQSPLLISGFRIFGEEIPFEKFKSGIDLTYKQNFFTFEFSGLRTNPAADVQYAYKLEGFDKDWNYTGNHNFASYTNVPGGHYTFKLKATNESGEWGAEQLSIPVMITPPFWKTTGFILLAVVSVIAVVYAFFQNRIKQIKKVYQLRSKISQDLHDEVGATLSGIALYSHLTGEQIKQKQTGQVEKSLEVIQKSAIQMVNKLNDIVWAVNPFHDSTGDLLQRLEEYALEMATARKIEVKTEIDEKIRQLILPMEHRKNIYLVCKESVNNAIKYAGCSRIKLSANTFDHHMEFIVEDDGKGFDSEKINRGNGLNNMQLRAEEINGELTIVSLKGNGTKIRLFCKIPH